MNLYVSEQLTFIEGLSYSWAEYKHFPMEYTSKFLRRVLIITHISKIMKTQRN